MKKLRLIIILGLLVGLLFSSTPVYADTPDPDSTPTIEGFNVYRNMRETGDMLVLIYATIPYSPIPDQPVTQTFIWSMIDTDNVTELGSTVGFAYNLSTHQSDGFNYNVFSMYWDAADVTALGITWGTSYTIRLSGNPAVFDTPPIYNYILSASDYSSLTTQADVQAELGARILTIAASLDIKWGLSSAYSLITELEAGTALSLYGEAFFRGAIFGIQSLAPGIFSVVIRTIDVPERTWDPAYSINVTDQWSGTWVETAKEGGKVLFGTTYDLLSIIMLLSMCGGLLIGNIMLTGDHWNGLIDVTAFGVIGARLGMYDLAFLILVAAMCWIYISAKIWFGLIR